MRKRLIFLWLGSLIIILIVILSNMKIGREWDDNAEKFKNSIIKTSNGENIALTNITKDFQWDEVYTFKPYTSKESICKIIGPKGINLNETINEGMNQVVFVKDKKIICYLYGYPDNNGYSFDFGDYEGESLKLSRKENPSFNIRTIDGIKTLKLTY